MLRAFHKTQGIFATISTSLYYHVSAAFWNLTRPGLLFLEIRINVIFHWKDTNLYISQQNTWTLENMSIELVLIYDPSEYKGEVQRWVRMEPSCAV